MLGASIDVPDETVLLTIISGSFAVAALLYGVFSLQLWLGWNRTGRGAWLVGATSISIAWAFAGFAFGRAPATLLWGLTNALDALRLGAWVLFLFSLLSPSGRLSPVSVQVRAVLLTVVALRVLVDLAVLGGATSVWFSPMLPMAMGLACAVALLVAVEQLYRNFPIDSRWSIKPLCLGLAAAGFFDVFVFSDAVLYRRFELSLWGARALAWALVMPLVAVSASRSHAWDFRIAVSREIVFHTTALAVVGGFLLAVAGAGYWVRYFGGDWGRVLQVLLVFCGVLGAAVLVFSGAFRARIRVVVSKHFFRYRYDYRTEWLRFIRILAGGGTSGDFNAAVIRALADLVESPGGLLFLRTSGGRFAATGRLNHPQVDADEAADSAFVAFLESRQWIVDLEEYRSRPSMYTGYEQPGWLEWVPDAWLIVPLFVEEELVGFVVLLTARAPVTIDWEVLDLLKTAARQAAVYLARMRASEALLEAQKFDSFNRMSAFVVHDLKNLVAQLQLMLRNAERHRDNPEFQQDMLDTVRHVQDRMKGLMTQLQEKKSIDPRKPVAVGELVYRIATAKKHQAPAVSVSVEGKPVVMAHAERLERVIGHLVQNALDAVDEAGIVTVSVVCEGQSVGIRVADNGRGMSAQFVRERLFRPFQTTKDAGMGIGAFEAQQYIAELGGTIQVDSELGRGTRMCVRLPGVESANVVQAV